MIANQKLVESRVGVAFKHLPAHWTCGSWAELMVGLRLNCATLRFGGGEGIRGKGLSSFCILRFFQESDKTLLVQNILVHRQ